MSINYLVQTIASAGVGTSTGTYSTAKIPIKGDFNLSIAGVTACTIVLQRSFNDGSTWNDVESFTANTEKRGFEIEDNIVYRCTCTIYSTDTVVTRISN